MPRNRFDDRCSLLSQIDSFKRRLETTRQLDNVGGVRAASLRGDPARRFEAFDLSKEDPRIVDRYDTSKLFRLEEVNKWGDMRRSSNLLGKQMLLARRLCEAGCGFVTVMRLPAGTCTPTATAPRTWAA